MHFNVNMANNLSLPELKSYLNDIEENAYSNLYNSARYYSMMKDLDKSNNILNKLLDTNDNIAYNARNQLICNYNVTFNTKKALELIKINEDIFNDIDLRNQKCYAMYLNDDFDNNIIQLLDTFEQYSPSWRNHCTMVSQYYHSIGDFKQGMRYHALSLHMESSWDINIKDIIIHVPYCGIGDEIVLLRLLPILTNRGYNVKWYSNNKDIIDIVHNMGYETSDNGYFVHGYDAIQKLDFDYNDIMIESYIKPSLEAIEKFKHCKGIGIRLSGNREALDEPMRQVPLELLQNYLPDVNHYSLHLENVTGLIYNDLKSLDDTLGLIHNLDYVVTACTSVAHLSCAMGKKTYVLTKKCCWYTWRKFNGKLAWYNDNCHVIRQTELLNWDVLKELEEL